VKTYRFGTLLQQGDAERAENAEGCRNCKRPSNKGDRGARLPVKSIPESLEELLFVSESICEICAISEICVGFWTTRQCLWPSFWDRPRFQKPTQIAQVRYARSQISQKDSVCRGTCSSGGVNTPEW